MIEVTALAPTTDFWNRGDITYPQTSLDHSALDMAAVR
jgi:hypothetical protein